MNHIYLVDDDAGFRESTAMLLEAHGYEVIDFSCAEFLAQFNEEIRPAKIPVVLDHFIL